MKQHSHHVYITDFGHVSQHSIFLKIAGFDAEKAQEFTGEVRILNGYLYGDLIHRERTELSESCRAFIECRLLTKYENGDFR
ncbi:hypothetical protein [Alkalihalobacillus trypoxylicola]|uniref:Uncharacterized protein n=1 Tax=Alkalihalobacillus trypoxylicola TaxID=519424 RepID=A0A161QGV9_9BACI|nr:hypothetical protein [Alkalihalobacillus trypoxylicola]KYG28220.1 hypothetical protein AZF04_09985 [Alkalihalobacillus trypoxylicola]